MLQLLLIKPQKNLKKYNHCQYKTNKPRTHKNQKPNENEW